MQVAFAKSNLSGRARTWALNLQLHDPNVFGSLAVSKTLLIKTFEPPRAEFRTLTDLLKIKQGKRDVDAYAQHIRHLASCMVANPGSEFVDHDILTGPHRWSHEEPPIPHRVEFA